MRTLSNSRKSAFTLIEMITVVGIITLLVVLVTPTLLDVIRSTRLSASGDSLVNRLSLAQQSAVSMSSDVELRFYRYINTTSDRPGEELFYAYQVVHTPQSGVQRALSEVYYLESGIIISRQEELSPLLQAVVSQQPDSEGQYFFNPPGNTSPDNVSYAAFRFYPDGSMRVLQQGNQDPNNITQTVLGYTVPAYNQSFVTIVESKDSQTTQPRNFFCVQIDSYTGKTRVYRP